MTEQGHVIRNRTNWFSGWLLALALPVFVIGVVDPLATHHAPTEGDGWNAFELIFTGGTAALSLAAYVLFARPMVVLGPTHVLVRNPTMVHVFPRALVQAAKRGLRYPRIVVGGRTIRVMALEGSLWQTMQGAPAQDGIIAVLAPDQGSAGGHLGRHARPEAVPDERSKVRTIRRSEDRLKSTPAPIDRVTVALVSVWLGYMLVGWLSR